MKHIMVLTGAAALMAMTWTGNGVAQTTQTPSPALPASPSSRVIDLINDYLTKDRVPGIVIGQGDGRGAVEFASGGHLSVANDAAAVGPDSLWRVYSMTKPITGMAAMALIEEGKLKLEQPIADFFPEFSQMRVLTSPETSLDSVPAKTQITVRHLLTHTSGLSYSIIAKGPLLKEYERLGLTPAAINMMTEADARPKRPTSLKTFAQRVATVPLIAEPGTKWSYSIGLDVLAAVIEAAAGVPFETYLQQRFFGPLGMTSTYWAVPEAETKRLADNYFWAGANRVPLDAAQESVFKLPPSFPYGGAGLVTSASDYGRFLAMLAGGGTVDGRQILRPETVALAMSNLLPTPVTYSGAPTGSGGMTGTVMGFGAGGSVQLNAVPEGTGKGTYGWGGAAGTFAWVDPQNQRWAVVMVNYMPPEKWPLRQDAVRAIYAKDKR